MHYAVQCDCGKTLQVPGAMAGGRVTCACGLEVLVPSLSKLKGQSGDSAMSAEIRLDDMLRRGILPQETTCLMCRKPTDAVSYCWTTCERPQVENELGWFQIVARVLMFNLLGLASDIAHAEGDTVHGRDLRYRLPLRVCPECTGQLWDARMLKETLLDVPVYADLLDKYPHADVSLDLGLAGIVRRDEL